MPDGSIVAECQNPAVPSSIIHEIWKFRNEGATMEQVVEYLRQRTIPAENTISTWKYGWS